MNSRKANFQGSLITFYAAINFIENHLNGTNPEVRLKGGKSHPHWTVTIYKNHPHGTGS